MAANILQPKTPAKSSFEKTIDGKQTKLFVLKSKKGIEVAITNYGGRIVSILVPDKIGKLVDVVEGFDSVDGYQNSTVPYYSGIIGRFGNRIANGEFTLEGKKYTLLQNNGTNSLHGSDAGYQDVVWDAKQIDETTLELTYLSKDMEGGFPGNLDIKVIYALPEDNGLKITYEATTDKTTIINLTNHPFFNLNGAGSGSILNHSVQLFADAYLPVNAVQIPTGEIAPVKDSSFDFSQLTIIGARINDENDQLTNGKGYDHNYVLNKNDETAPIAIVVGDKTDIEMQVFTTEPGMQFYTGNFMPGVNQMKYGNMDDFRTAFAMETQHFPDSPNHPEFPSTILKPGQVYQSTTEYRFTLDHS
jgi:aldose 1-epimerase